MKVKIKILLLLQLGPRLLGSVSSALSSREDVCITIMSHQMCNTTYPYRYMHACMLIHTHTDKHMYVRLMFADYTYIFTCMFCSLIIMLLMFSIIYTYSYCLFSSDYLCDWGLVFICISCILALQIFISGWSMNFLVILLYLPLQCLCKYLLALIP